MGYNVNNSLNIEQLKFENDEKKKDDLLADLYNSMKDHETITKLFGI